jgi:hypothetical protein
MSTQMGGMVFSFQEVLSKLDSPAKLIYGFILLLLIVYSPIVPLDYRRFMDSLLGRVFGIAIVYGVIESLGWVYGLLTALVFLTMLRGISKTNPLVVAEEGFDGGGTVSEKRRIGKRWFVEKVLGENPIKIATDKVQTTAVQD